MPTVQTRRKRHISESGFVTPDKRKKPKHMDPNFTTLKTKEMIANVSPYNLLRYEMDIKKDDAILEKNDRKQALYDADYIAYETYGLVIESWIADNMKCPTCGKKTLRRYLRKNMPIIDVACINPAHTREMGVRFFQIKSSEENVPFQGYLYFSNSIESRYIHVGSKNYGKFVHRIKPIDTMEKKRILIGYICICYRSNESTNRLTIIPNKSFIVSPKMYVNPTARNSGICPGPECWYYRYISKDKPTDKNAIEFNLLTNNIITGQRLVNLIKSKTIPPNYLILDTGIDNPLSKMQ